MTMDERIEAAARSVYSGAGKEAYEFVKDQARVMLAAAFPELTGDKPEGWIAPWEPTKKMRDTDWSDYGGLDNAWEVLRDAYLGKGDGG